MKVHLLYRQYISPSRMGAPAELVDIYLQKDKATEVAEKKNSYTKEGRVYEYFVKSKIAK